MIKCMSFTLHSVESVILNYFLYFQKKNIDSDNL